MYNNYYGDNESFDEFDVQQNEDSNTEDSYRANDDLEIENDFVRFTPFYYCPFFRQQHFPGSNPPPRPPYTPPVGHDQEHGMHPGQHEGMPFTPPPSFKPPKPQGTHMHEGIRPRPIDPAALRRCRFRFVYIWLRNGNSFWAYLTYVGRTFASGYRWNGRRWVQFSIDLRRIEDFHCH